MLILGCDTSSVASGALVRLPDDVDLASGPLPADALAAAEVLGSFATADTRSHAEAMAPGIRRLLAEAGVRGEELDLILTGVGPGPFTGLRAGIMTARTMGWAWGVPVRGAVSTDALAEKALPAAAATGTSRFLVATDARRREVYAALCETGPDGGFRRVSGPVVGPAAEVLSLLGAEPVPVVGRGARLYPEALPALPGTEELDHPTADALVLAAARTGLRGTTAETSPLYLRESDAKVPAARKKAAQ